MTARILDLIDFAKVDTLLEGFNKSTGFVTAILDLEGNVLSKSGWRQICTEFHRIHPETSKRCTISDTVLANKMSEGENYHFYQCLNGLVDVAVPIVVKGDHIANLFSGQFFFEEPDESFFQKQATKYGFNNEIYLKAFRNVPVVSKEKVKVAMDFLLNMTQMISEMTFQKLEQTELNEAVLKSENILRLFVEHSPASIAMFDNNMRYLVASQRFRIDYNLGDQVLIGRSHYEIFPEISERWKEFHRRGLAGETLKEDNDSFPRADGKTDWVRWEIRPWYESDNQIGGIILFSEVITAQIEDREALKESEIYNRMLFEQSAIGLALTSFDGRMVDINPTFANIIGCTIEETKSLTYWDITPEKYQHQEQQQLESLAKTGKYGPYEKEYIHKDGHLVPVRLQGLIIERNNEKLIWSSVEDISEQKKTEHDLIAAKEEIEASERIKTDLVIKFNEAQQSAKTGNWDWDMVTNKVWWSDELYRIFDLDPNGFVPSVESNAKYVHPDDNGPYHHEVQRVIENKEELNTVLRIISGNGTLKYCNSRAKLELDKNGNPVRFYGTFADVTERKKAELELLANHKLLTDTLESMSDAFVSLDRNWCYTYMNEKAGAIFGRDPKEIIGKNIWTEFPEGVGQPFQLNYEKVMNEKVFIRIEEYYPPYNMWFENRINPTDDGIAIFFQNITERKLAELEQARMLESEKAALNEANEAKEQLSQILERISDGFGSLDRDWNYIFVNEKLAKNVGRKREELLGRNIWEVFPEAIGTAVHKAYLRAMEEQVAIDLEHFYPHFGRWFQHRFYPSPDGLSVFSKDITESKLAEEKIKEHSSLIRIAAEKAKLGGWNVDLKENRSYWSDEVAAIHEMPPGYAPLVEDGINFYAPEWRERIIKVFTDCVQNGVTYDEEMEIITSSGKRVWVRTIGEAVSDENGKIYKVQGAFQNISERKLTEAKSREKDLQFRKLSANVPDLLFQFTRRPDGTYCVPVASEGIKNIFGCSPEDVVDDFTPIGKVIYPDDAERVVADIENSAKNLTHFTSEFRVQIPGKPVQWILTRSTPEKLPDGSITWYGFNADITQRKEYEDALRESEGKFRKIYEEGPFGMALVNSSFKFIMVNRTFCEITGYTESVLRELTFRDITYPDDKDIGVESVKKLIKGEIPVFRSEKRYVRKDGQVIWGAITVTAHFDKNGNFLYNLSIVEDITGRKQAEEVLREREYLLSSSQRAAHVGTWSWKVGDTTTYWSDETYRIYGLSPEMGPPEFEFFFKIIHPEDRLKMQEWPQAVLAGFHPDPIEFRVLRPDGIYRVIQTDGDVIETVDGVPSRIAGTAYDITERKLADEKIKTLNERLQLLVEAIQELSISTSMENIMETVRTSARKLVNADGSTFILRDGDSCYYADEDTVSPLWKGQRFPLINCISGWAMLNKQHVIIEDIYADDRIPIEAYKSTFVRSLAIAPIRLNDPLGAIGAYWGRNYLPSEIEIKLLNTLADAAAKAVENIQLIEGLEQKITQRTSQLQAANKELETFTYSVSHDLKAPLRGIDGYSKLLSDLYAADLNDEAKYFISTIRSSTLQMSQLIEDLLQYSRLERTQITRQPVNLNNLIDSILKINENEITKYNINIMVNVPDNKLIADAGGMQIALRNLIENAIKFSKKVTSPELFINFEEQTESWVVMVKDNGVGFDMKYSERIFEIFQRLHRAEDYPGTGIGLAMVNKAVQRMNGQVWAESMPGQGATFYIEIPKLK